MASGDNDTSTSNDIDDSSNDADWDAKANFDMHFSLEDESIESPKKRRPPVGPSLSKSMPRSNFAPP